MLEHAVAKLVAPFERLVDVERRDREGHEEAFAHPGESSVDAQMPQDLVIDDRERVAVIDIAQGLRDALCFFLLCDFGDDGVLRTSDQLAELSDRVAKLLLFGRGDPATALLPALG